MNDSETANASSELSEQISALQRQAFILLLALIVVSGTFVAYVYYQSRQLSKAVAQVRPIAQEYNQVFPEIQTFVRQLAAYGQTHPDFQKQILDKFKITPQTVAPPKP